MTFCSTRQCRGEASTGPLYLMRHGRRFGLQLVDWIEVEDSAEEREECEGGGYMIVDIGIAIARISTLAN